MNFILSLLAIVISLFGILNMSQEKLGVATIVSVPQGGSSTSTLPLNAVILGGGTGAFTGSSSPSLGAIFATSTATSTLFRGVNIEGGCFAIGGICTAASAGITSLGGLTAASQSFTAQGPLLISSLTSTHTFIASSSPTFGELKSTTTLAVATTTLGTGFVLGVHGDALIAGSTTVKGLLATSTVEALQLRIGGTATSTFVGGITSAGTGSFTGGLMLGNALNNTSAATSSFTGGITSAGLLSSNGLIITGGSVLNTSTASSTWSGGLLTTSAMHTSGLTISGGSLLITSTASSSFSGGLSVASLASSGGLTLTGGGISALPYTGLFGSIGIGTATPSQILGVHGDSLIAGTTTVKGIFATSTIETLSLKTYGTATNTFAGGIQFTGSANICTAGGACLGGGGGAASLFTDGGATTYLTSTDNLGVASTSVDTRFGIGTYGLLVSGTSTLGSLWATSSTIYLGATSTPYKFPDFKTASGTVLTSDGNGNLNGYFPGMQLLGVCRLAVASSSCGFVNLPKRRFYTVMFDIAGLSTNGIGQIIFDGDRGANYGTSADIGLVAENSPNDSACLYSGTSNRALRGLWVFDIANPTTHEKSVTFEGTIMTGSATPVPADGACNWNNNASLTSVSLQVTQGATFNAGTAAFIWDSAE